MNKTSVNTSVEPPECIIAHKIIISTENNTIRCDIIVKIDAYVAMLRRYITSERIDATAVSATNSYTHNTLHATIITDCTIKYVFTQQRIIVITKNKTLLPINLSRDAYQDASAVNAVQK